MYPTVSQCEDIDTAFQHTNNCKPQLLDTTLQASHDASDAVHIKCSQLLAAIHRKCCCIVSLFLDFNGVGNCRHVTETIWHDASTQQ